MGAEYRGASLGDARRGRRLERIAGELARNPGLSFLEAMGSEGQLEGLYRFLNNEQVCFEAVHAPGQVPISARGAYQLARHGTPA
ncbi:MAG: transposase DNA-binding-containing protein [Polyangiaceae bacterium]